MENTQENFSFVANLKIGGFTHLVLFLLPNPATIYLINKNIVCENYCRNHIHNESLMMISKINLMMMMM